jgi:hypothetical protein
MTNGKDFTLATALRSFLGDYLPHQRAYSVNTILSYRDSLKLLLVRLGACMCKRVKVLLWWS